MTLISDHEGGSVNHVTCMFGASQHASIALSNIHLWPGLRPVLRRHSPSLSYIYLTTFTHIPFCC